MRPKHPGFTYTRKIAFFSWLCCDQKAMTLVLVVHIKGSGDSTACIGG
ncbi:MAG: hypothetical protein J7K89_02905 [Candidatus Cloacimonetes bacterium]|nr:hypothetical protein [Candidatus Cloacimonadota bacterium]